jgi:hypothetical protein
MMDMKIERGIFVRKEVYILYRSLVKEEIHMASLAIHTSTLKSLGLCTGK